ncbi:YtxH domain-containing protein [Clostridium lacusfryxellense]|uniref:YtxH domain-containing protein n=1 Tax=Clostridium lacusfryxellense TaxID=205328 RepID=UPI001C0C5DF3|nr:YtxH domain-containing protein [Clostridium lacusfryxellense]MBU3111276.1 YtxH domain-containing protein [Clostridium lacusfryxellense]
MLFSSWFKNRKKEILKQSKIKTAKKVAIGTVAGSLSGLLGGLLFSPKSGKENRDDIVKSSKDITNNIKDRTTELKDTIDNKVTDVKSSVTESKTKISEYLNGKKNSKDIVTDEETSSK